MFTFFAGAYCFYYLWKSTIAEFQLKCPFYTNISHIQQHETFGTVPGSFFKHLCRLDIQYTFYSSRQGVIIAPNYFLFDTPTLDPHLLCFYFVKDVPILGNLWPQSDHTRSIFCCSFPSKTHQEIFTANKGQYTK